MSIPAHGAHQMTRCCIQKLMWCRLLLFYFIYFDFFILFSQGVHAVMWSIGIPVGVKLQRVREQDIFGLDREARRLMVLAVCTTVAHYTIVILVDQVWTREG
jgi:hypothetical protein